MNQIGAWSIGQPLGFRDRHPSGSGQLVTIHGLQNSASIVANVSSDFNATTSAVTIGSITDQWSRVVSAVQDSSGTVHMLTLESGLGGITYRKFTFAYSGGTISGIASALTSPILVNNLTGTDLHASVLCIKDQSGADCLAALTSGGDSGGVVVWIQKTLSLTVSSSSDFTAMDGSAGHSVIINQPSGSNGHEYTATFAQLGSTRDIYVRWGFTASEWSAVVLNHVRCTASGAHTWSVGASVAETAGPRWSYVGGMYGTNNSVWAASIDVENGLRIDRFSADGTLTLNALAQPYPRVGYNLIGWGLVSAKSDDSRVFAFASCYGDLDIYSIWDGTSWTNWTQSSVLADGFGAAESSSWDSGLAIAAFSNDGLGEFTPYHGSVYVAEAAPPSPIAANVTGSTTVSATIRARGVIGGSVAGSTSVAAIARASGVGAAAVSGATSVVAAVRAAGVLAAALAGATTVGAAVRSPGVIAASVAGVTAVTATVTQGSAPTAIAANVVGGTTVSATITARGVLSSNAAGGTSVGAGATAPGAIAAQVTGSTAVAATLTQGSAPSPIAASVYGSTTVTATATAPGVLSASPAGASFVAAAGMAQGVISAAVVGSTSVSATVVAIAANAIVAAVQGSTTVSATLLGGPGVIAGAAAGATSVQAQAGASGALSAQLAGATVVGGTVTAPGALGASVVGATAGAAVGTAPGTIAAAVVGSTNVSATISTASLGTPARRIAVVTYEPRAAIVWTQDERMRIVISSRMAPGERLDFEIDYGPVMARMADTIVESTWTMLGDARVDREALDQAKAIVWIQDVPEYSQSIAVNTIRTSGGRRIVRGIAISGV